MQDSHNNAAIDLGFCHFQQMVQVAHNRSVGPCLAFFGNTSFPPTESKRVLSLFRFSEATSSISRRILVPGMARTVLGSGAGRRLDQSFRPLTSHLKVGLVSFGTDKHIPAQQPIAGVAPVFFSFSFSFWVYLPEEDSPFWVDLPEEDSPNFSQFSLFFLLSWVEG